MLIMICHSLDTSFSLSVNNSYSYLREFTSVLQGCVFLEMYCLDPYLVNNSYFDSIRDPAIGDIMDL